MKLSDFDYNLPEKLIAQNPMEPRDHSRLLVLDRKTGSIEHHTFYEMIDFLKPGDVLVLNNSKVFPARLFGTRADTGGKVEILLNKNISPPARAVLPLPEGELEGVGGGVRGGGSQGSTWEVVGKNLKLGTKIEFGCTLSSPPRWIIGVNIRRGSKIVNSKLEATVLDRKDKIATVEFNMSGEEFFTEIEKIGHIPLPPYIKKDDTNKDKINYQTIYAKDRGSVAAPTAGLHFTDELLKKIKEKGIEIAEVTLHVGLGTFAPVEEENIENHKIHSEYYTVIPSEIKKIIKAKKEGHRVIAVGTTSTRVLETIFSDDCHPRPIPLLIKERLGEVFDRGSKNSCPLLDSRFRGNDNIEGRNDNIDDMKGISGETNIFIYPGYKFKCVDGLITNFHLQKSTLLMLVCAFAGKKNIDRAYQEAIKRKYRFYSYGDAMLII